MAPEETRTPASAKRADEVRAFYESHPYPKHRELYATRTAPGMVPTAVADREAERKSRDSRLSNGFTTFSLYPEHGEGFNCGDLSITRESCVGGVPSLS